MAGKPIIQWQIEWLKNAGVEDFVLSVGHLAEKVQAVMGDGSGLGVFIRYAVEREPLGTAGALRNAMEEGSVDGPFYAGNGDVLTDLDPRQCEGLRSGQGLVAALALVPLPSPYGIIEAEDNGLVTAFREKPLLPHWINAGFYSLSQDVFDYLPIKGQPGTRRISRPSEEWAAGRGEASSPFLALGGYTQRPGGDRGVYRLFRGGLVRAPGLGPGESIDVGRSLG